MGYQEDAVKKYRQRRAARLGFETINHYDSVKEYRRRRAERLASRMDADGDEETAPKSGGHGNTRIPFGLCQREGIKVQPGWTPQDAWKALEGKGYSAGETYRELKQTGKVSGKAKTTPVKKSFENLTKDYEDMRAQWKAEDDKRRKREVEASHKSLKVDKLGTILERDDYHGETLEEITKMMDDAEQRWNNGDDTARKEYHRCRAVADVMDTFGEDVFSKDFFEVREQTEKELKEARSKADWGERNQKREALLKEMAEAAKEKYPNISDCDSAIALESRLRGDDYFKVGGYTFGAMDYSGMPEETVKDLGAALDGVKKKFPSLSGRLSPPIMSELDYGVYAATGGDMMTLNKDVFTGDHNEAVKSLKKDEKSGFHPKGCNSFASVINHEYGHVVDALLTNRFRDEIDGETFCSRVMKRVMESHPDETPMSIMQQVSTYSWKNQNPTEYSEFVAEAFSEYTCSKKPRPIAAEVGKIVEEYINRLGE